MERLNPDLSIGDLVTEMQYPEELTRLEAINELGIVVLEQDKQVEKILRGLLTKELLREPDSEEAKVEMFLAYTYLSIAAARKNSLEAETLEELEKFKSKHENKKITRLAEKHIREEMKSGKRGGQA